MNHKFKGPVIELFLNGDPPKKNLYSKFLSKKIFAVDGSLNYLKKFKIPVDSIIGDFDSLLKKNISVKNTIINTYNQNYTDFEKALNIIYKKGFLNVNIWGGSGKEQDHFLGNLSIALKYKKKLSIIFYDKYHLYFFSDKKNTFYMKKNKKISLFPFPKVVGLKTFGLKYPIKNESLEIGKKLGIRNKSISNENNKIQINYKKGELLIFIEIER
ncbi:thiamine diphosphokinase [Blattabacterium cuenoti]|uniref:thiamine diphosphokinase n=1 Tax=Blattabacterium cuenoti TaxID=1653831 RepID=UPI00163C8758|nr:thiamine diphosphokinase [Blattabacterium cuenoti]